MNSYVFIVFHQIFNSKISSPVPTQLNPTQPNPTKFNPCENFNIIHCQSLLSFNHFKLSRIDFDRLESDSIVWRAPQHGYSSLTRFLIIQIRKQKKRNLLNPHSPPNSHSPQLQTTILPWGSFNNTIDTQNHFRCLCGRENNLSL
jgi:hypothetical protein